MLVYSKDEVVEIIKLEVKDGERKFTADIYTLINLIDKGKIKQTEVITSKYKLKVNSIIEHPNNYYGYTGILIEQWNPSEGKYLPIDTPNVILSCQKEFYERHRYFLAGLDTYNAYDFYWVNREFSKYGGVYYTSKDFIYDNITDGYISILPFLDLKD